MIQIFHQSRRTFFRDPFGAVPCGSTIRLRLRIHPDHEEVRQVRLCYYYGLYHFKSSFQQMSLQANNHCSVIWYHAELHLPQQACLLFYWFEVETNQRTHYVTANSFPRDGSSVISSERPKLVEGQMPSPLLWQVTVYRNDFRVPAWFRGKTMYQIFPDRFKRGADYSFDRMIEAYPAEERIYHQDWQEEVDIEGKPAGNYLACDFFGGSLQGIAESLDYLNDIGIDVIYLNPIFKARSNHRYDTGDYEQIDPLLGSNEDFKHLCEQAKTRGIRIILDGVFSHTGADSRYFNRLGRYEEVGAWQQQHSGEMSDYGSWYQFQRRDNRLFYESWWGFADLPNVNEHDLNYQYYITGPGGIIQRWIEAGASGWRLDVSDELPDSFIRSIHHSARKVKEDAVILGEIWEDATCKISYGGFRDFLLGDTHDSAMGYPFQTSVSNWLRYRISAEIFRHQLDTIREHYPLPAFYSSMNLLSSHDIPRAITTIAGDPDPGDRVSQGQTRLSPEQRKHGEALLLLGTAFQVAYPGNAALYYGDEYAAEGYRDPYNRRTFRREKCQGAYFEAFRTLARLRRNYPVLGTGGFRYNAAENHVLVFTRYLREGRDVFGCRIAGPEHMMIAFNRSNSIQTVRLKGRHLILKPYSVIFEAEDDLILEITDGAMNYLTDELLEHD